MTVSLKHTFQSVKPDGSDATLVQPSNWNDEHVMTAAAGKVIGRDTSGAGAVQELPIAVTAGGNVGIGTTTPGSLLTVAGIVESTSGGVKFPDGTTQISAASAVGYAQNVQSGNYTPVLSDAGKQIYSANTGAQTITIPTNASVAFPVGSLITIVNMGTNSIRVSGAGVTLYPNGSISAMSFANIVPGQLIQLLKTATNVWNCTFGSLTNAQFSYLVIAGGGGGSNLQGGGGGAGGYIEGVGNISAGTRTVTVGAGGAVFAFGANSSLTGFTTAIGGGYGGTNSTNGFGISGGSGGGGGGNGAGYIVGGNGTGVQGYKGGDTVQAYASGGGGGAGEPAPNGAFGNPSRGGNGLASSITGTSVTRGGGGGAGSIYFDPGAAGGTGGGGTGAGSVTAATAGTANTGGGGGGASGFTPIPGAAGGSGVVIISSPIAAASTTGSPTVTTSGGNTIYTFTSSGTITW